jgi:hypothetical protein
MWLEGRNAYRISMENASGMLATLEVNTSMDPNEKYYYCI